MRAGFRIQAVVAGAAAVVLVACAAPIAPTGTIDELRAFRERAVREERVAEAVLASQAIVDAELARKAGAGAPAHTAAARAWFDLGDAQVAAYDREAARVSYQAAIDALADGGDPADPIDARAHTQLALLDRTHLDALGHASRGVGILETRYAGKHRDIVAARIALADTLWVAQSLVDSHAELVRAVRDARELMGNSHAETATAYFRLAAGNEVLKRPAEAEALYRESIGVYERMSESGQTYDREKRSEVHQALANFYQRRRRKSESLAQRALAVEYSDWTHKQVRTKGVNPLYPPHAREKKVEGWVEVIFTISKSGRTEDVHIVEAVPDGVFERAALWAVEHWRYQPGLRDGAPAEQRNVRARLSFETDD